MRMSILFSTMGLMKFLGQPGKFRLPECPKILLLFSIRHHISFVWSNLFKLMDEISFVNFKILFFCSKTSPFSLEWLKKSIEKKFPPIWRLWKKESILCHFFVPENRRLSPRPWLHTSSAKNGATGATAKYKLLRMASNVLSADQRSGLLRALQ